MIGAVVNIGLNCVLIPKWKGTGAAIATAIGYMVILAINMVMTYRIIKIDFMIMRNLLCYCLLIIEIISVLSASLMGIVIAFGCVIGIMLLNVKEFVFLAKRITDRSAQK